MAGKSKFSIVAEDATASAWKSVANNAKQTADQVSHVWEAAFAGISVAAIVEIGNESLKMGEELEKAAKKAGIGGKAMSELAFAAKMADVDITSLSTALKKMQVALSQAATGEKQPNQALAALGLSIKQLQGLQADQQMEILADQISRLPDAADRARAATDLFGRAGADLLPLFEKGAAGIQQARHEAEELGAVLGDDQLKQLTAAEEAIKKMSAAWHAFAMTLTAAVAPAITTTLNALTSRESQLEQQIRFLEKIKGEGFVSANPLGSAGTFKDIGTGVFSADQAEAKLEDLKRQLAFVQAGQGLHPELGGRGRPSAVPGYAAADADAKAAAAAKKADAASSKLVDQFMKNQDEFDNAFDKEMDGELKSSNDAWTEQMIAWNKFEEGRQAKEEETNQAITHMREEQAAASAQQFVDVFDNAFNAMESSGKLSVGRLAKYIIAELAQKAIASLIGKLFGSSGSSGSSIAGSAASSIVGSLFGGARAGGGDVLPGRSYLVGERGPELVRFGARGSVTPNSALGGATLAPVINYNITGGSDDTLRKVERMQRESERRMLEQLDRRHKLVTG